MSKWVQAHMYASSTWFKSSTGEISAHETTFYSLKDLSKTKRVTTRARSVSIVQKHPGRVKHELKWHMRNDAYKPIKRLGAVSFSIASILYIHLSIHILLYECVHLICIRHTSSLKLFADAHVEVPEKNITRQKHHKNCKHQTTWIHCAKMIDSRSFTFLCADRGIRTWHSSLVVRWVAWPKKLHMVALPRFGLHWPYDSPFCFSCILSQLTGVVWAWWDTCLRKSKKVSKIPALLRCPCLVGQPGC